MSAYQAGEMEAFDRLYAGLAPLLRRRLAALANDAAWVDDLLQETFLQIHRARRTYNNAFPVQPWALAIARHVFLMSLRSRRRRRYFDTADPSELEAIAQRDHESACLARDGIQRCLAVLTPGTREAVVLHHLLGMSFQETASRLGIRSTAAKLRVSRGMVAIQRRFAGRRRRRRVSSRSADEGA
jgi:RNA polymerase sigma-70 factor (ECF subfamily)